MAGACNALGNKKLDTLESLVKEQNNLLLSIQDRVQTCQTKFDQ